MANVTLFSGQCSIEYLYVNSSTAMYLPVLPFDKSNITSSNYSNFTLSVTVNNNAILTDAPFIDATHINTRSGGPRGTIQSYEEGSIGWGVRVYDSNGATINFTTSDTVTMTLVGPEEFAPTPGPTPSTEFIFSNVKKIELTRLPVGYTEVDYLYPNSTQDGVIVTNITHFTQGKTFELVVSDLSILYTPFGPSDIESNFTPLFQLYEYVYGTTLSGDVGERYLMLGKNKDNNWILEWGPYSDPKEYYILTGSDIPDSSHKLKITVTRPATADWKIVIYDMTTESTVFTKTVTDTTTSHTGTINYPPAVVMDGGTSNYARGKLYSIKVTDSNNDLINNLVPAKTASGDTGMYDTINCVFLHTQKNKNNPEHVNVPVGPDASTPATLLEVIKIEDYYNGALRTLWSKAAEPTPSTVEPLSYDDTIVWTVGAGVANSSGYYYYPLTANGETGVMIALTDNQDGWNSDGKPTTNTEYSWEVKFPSAGWYQMVVTAGYSSSGANVNFAGYNKVDIDGMGGVSSYYSYLGVDPTSNLDIQIYTNSQGTDYDAPGILVSPYVNYSNVPNFVMTQGGDTPKQIVLALVYVDDATVEHIISYKCTSYRLVFDSSSNIVFRKLNNYEPPANPNS